MAADELDFQTIHAEFQPKILRYLKRLVGEQEAEDLAQEVFVKVSQGLKTFRGDSQLSTWIYRIATNAALDRLRSRSSQKRMPEDLIGEDKVKAEDTDVWTREKKPSLETSLIREEMKECIRAVVDSLPMSYRTIIALSDLQELSNHEIAEVLGLSLDAVKIRLHRARERLKKELEQHCSFYRDERNEFACDRKIAPLKFLKK